MGNMKEKNNDIEQIIKNLEEQEILEAVGDGISIQDTDFKILYQNRVCKSLIGDHVGEYCYKAYEQREKTCEGCPLAMVFDDGKIHATERSAPTDKGMVHVEITASPLKDSTGKIIAGVEVVRDIMERKHTQEALLESENEFRSLAEKSLVGIYLFRDGVFKYVNPKLAEIFGYTVEELIDKKGPQDLALPEDWLIVEENIRRRISGEIEAVNYNVRGIKKNKDIIYIEVYGSRTIYQGQPAVIGTLLDITERKRGEDSLKESEAKFQRLSQEFRALLDAIPDNLTLQSPDLKVLWANQGAAAGLDMRVSDMVGQYCYKLWHNRSTPCEICPVQKSFRTGNPENYEVSTPDSRIWDLKTVPIRDENGRLISVIEVGRDITERKKMEKEVKERVEELEKFYEMAIGRELRMKELKDEIKRLQIELVKYQK